MNCPKCGWPGLIGGSLKQRVAQLERQLETATRVRREDVQYWRDRAAIAEGELVLAKRAESSMEARKILDRAVARVRNEPDAVLFERPPKQYGEP
jgi:hypothetical protein